MKMFSDYDITLTRNYEYSLFKIIFKQSSD